MPMSRKHYKRLAEIIRRSRLSDAPEYMSYDTFMDSLTSFLAEDNPRFDCGRFIKRVGGESG